MTLCLLNAAPGRDCSVPKLVEFSSDEATLLLGLRQTLALALDFGY